MTPPKERLHQLIKQLREAANAQDPAARAVVDMVKLMGDEVKENLVAADGDDMLRKQGAARQLAKLYKDLTTTPPNIANPQE